MSSVGEREVWNVRTVVSAIEPEEFTMSISRALGALKLTVVIVTMLGVAGCASMPLSRETPGASSDDAAIRSSSLGIL